MSPFVLEFLGPPPLLQAIDGEARWILFRRLRASINSHVVIIPSGFTTDLATVPRLARFLVDDDDPDILRAAILHDFLYAKHGQAWAAMACPWDREQCDAVLCSGMIAAGAPEWKASLVYCAVRLGGWRAWAKC